MVPAGRDPAGWLLALAMRSLPPGRRAWGQAMHAELASIDRGTDRLRFSLGCLRVAVWQGPLWRVVGCLALQGAALALALSSAIGGLFRAEVIGLVLVAPPVLWWIGGGARGFRLGPTRSARVGRGVGYGLVAACVVVAVGFIAAEIEHRPDGHGVSAFWLGVVLLVLAIHTRDILGVTSARSTVSAAAMTSGAGFGVGAGLAAYALLPFSQSLDVHGAWLAAAYPAALASALVGAPAAAGMRAARTSRSVRPGLHAGGCAGLAAGLVLFIVGVGSVWLRPELVDSSIFDKGPGWLPAETRGVAGTYVIALVLVPVLGLLFGALGATIGRASTAGPVNSQRRSAPLRVATAGLALAVLVAAGALCYPLTHVFDGRDTTSFGAVGTTAVAFSANESALVTANGYQTAILWNLADRAHPTRSATFFGAAAFAPNGRTLATRGLLWNVVDPAHPTRIAAFDGGDPAVFSADGRRLASENNGVGMLWDVADRAHPRRTGTFTGAADAFSRDGRTFATTDSCATDRAGFEVRCATTLWSVTDRARPSRTAAVSGANAVFWPDGHALITRAAHDTVLLWSLADPRHPQRIATLVCGADDRPPAAVAFSPDGRSLATGSEDGTVKLWQVADPRRPTRTAVLTRETQGAGVVAFSHDATTSAGAAVDGANSVSLWRIGAR